jgi:hypothetical protein
MRQPMPSTRAREVVLLVQPRDEGLHMYATCLARPRPRGYRGLGHLGGAARGDEGCGVCERPDRNPIFVLTACAWDAERERATLAGWDLFL